MPTHLSSQEIYAIIVNWNRPEDTINCISSILDQDRFQIKIVLVDNGSEDNSINILKNSFPGLTILRNPTNVGFARGYNTGIIYALDSGADFIFIINNDAYIEPRTIHTLLKYAQESNIGIVAPIIYYSNKPDLVWSAGGNLRPLLLEYTNKEAGNRKDEYLDEVLDRDFVTGCCFLAPKHTFQRIGFFDESFSMYYEDADFCFRVRKLNLKIQVITSASAWHKVSLSSGGRDSPNERYWMGKSSIKFYRKHASRWQLFFIIPFRIGSAFRTLMRLIMKMRFRSAASYARGIFDGLKLKETNQ